MSSVQEDQQGWTRHWEVLDRVGLSDYTPDLQWHADVLHRAGGQQARPASSIQERRVSPMALSSGGSAGNDRGNGSGGSGSSQNRVAQSYPLPARFAVAAAVVSKSSGGDRGNINNKNNNNNNKNNNSSSSGGGSGGPINLHPRLRPGLAKQPANWSRQPRLPLDSALNLQLVENPEMYGPYQVQAQEWSSTSPVQPPVSLEHQEPFGGTAVLAVPRLELPATGTAPSLRVISQGGGGSAVTGAVYDSDNGGMDGRKGGDGLSSGGGVGRALPSLAQSPGGGSGDGGGWNVAVAPLVATAQVDTGSSGGGGGGREGMSSRGVSVVSFRIPLPSVPTTPAARIGPPAVGAVVLQQPGDSRAAGGGSSVTWVSTAPSQQEPGSQSFVRNEGGHDQQQQPQISPPPLPSPLPQQQQQQQYHVTPTWRPAPVAGGSGSGSLTPRLPPSRKTSADMSYMPYSSPSHPNPPPQHHPYFQQQQIGWPSVGRSLSGEQSSVPRFGNAVQQFTTSRPSPRDRYRGILERAGRAAVHKHHERRRPGAAAAAAGFPRRRSRKPAAAEFDAEMDSEGAGSGDHGSGGGGSYMALDMASDGLGQWGGRWIQQLTALNMEAGAGRDGRTPSSDEAGGEVRSGTLEAAAGSSTLRAGALPASAAAATEGDQNSGQSQNLHSDAVTRRVSVAEHAVWRLRQALDELSRFSCAHAVRQSAEDDVSVLLLVDARIQALKKYDRVELGPDGRRTSVIPQPPPAFPLDAAHEYLAAAQSGIAGLEELEDVVASMRKKLQIIVGQDTEDLRRAAAEALAEAGPGRVSEPRASEPCDGGGDQIPFPIRRPSNSTPVGAANGFTGRSIQYQNYQLSTTHAGGMEPQSSGISYNIPRLASAMTSLSGLDSGVHGFGDMGTSGYIYSQQSTPQPTVNGGAAALPSPIPPHSLPVQPVQTPPQPFPSSWNSLPIRKTSNASSASTLVPSGPMLDQAWALLESLVLQLHDSHASRIDMMDAFDKRASTDTGGGAAAAALLGGVPGPMQNHRHRRRPGGGFDRISGLVNVINESGAVNSLTEVKEAAVNVAVNGNAVRAAVAATLEPKHTEQALYFLAKLALILQQDPRLPLDVGFLVSAGVDLLLGEMSWLLALLRCSSGAGSPHLAALAAVLRAYEMQTSYTTTLMAVAKRLEQAAEEAMDRAAVLEQQLAASHTALQRTHHEVVDTGNNMREMERDMRAVMARNQLLEETVADLEGNLEVVETAHAARSATLQQADQLAGMMLEEHLGRIRLRSKRVQVASEGDCSDPRAIPPVLEPTANQYYPITPCVSSRHLTWPDGGRKGGDSSPLRSGTRKHLGKGHASRKAGFSRAVSRREKHGGVGAGGGGDAAKAAAAVAAAAALAAARAAVDASENEDAADGTDGEGAQWEDSDAPKTRDSAFSASRLAALKRSVLRTVSWVDRAPRRGGSSDPVQHRGSAEGCISPVNWAVAAAAAAAAPAAEDGSDSDVPAAAAAAIGSGGGGKTSPRVHPPAEEGIVATTGSGRERSRSPSSRPKSSRARKKGSSPDRQKQTTVTTTQRQSDSQQQQEEEQQQQQEEQRQQFLLLEQQQEQQQQPSQLRQQGIDGLEYWTQPGGEDGSRSTGDGVEQRRQLEMLEDAALEQAARDMFSDVFEQRQS